MGWIRLAALLIFTALAPLSSWGAEGEALPRDTIAARVMPPFSVGEPVNDKGVYELLNSGGALAGYVFQTIVMAPLPGFSGAPINVLVTIDLDGQFKRVELLEHNEPIFVSGLGQAPFHAFFEQYEGHSISDALVVGSPYGDAATGSSLVYLDGVTKATASVRIAHETILAATREVAREKMSGISTAPPAYPNPDIDEQLTWQDLVDQGLAKRTVVTNGEVNEAFAGTVWADDDAEALANPEEPFLDLWVVDLGPESVARAALSDSTLDELRDFLAISASDEPILLIETARHGLVSDDFVRNTSPDWLSAEQDGFPVALRDSDIFLTLGDDVPDGAAMILRIDRRLGFDPSRPWTLNVQAVREHGMFMPQIGSVQLAATYEPEERFYVRPGVVEPMPAWLEAVYNRQGDLIVLGLLLVPLTLSFGLAQHQMAKTPRLTPLRLTVLVAVLVFVGWWGQGQLSIVTVLGVIRTAWDNGSFAFLAYEPFSLIVWGAAIIGFVLWGRALFCGWLCPFGALQEILYRIARVFKLPKFELSAAWDARMKWLKYVLLAGLVATVFIAPDHVDTAAEVEPFKTAITVFFVRDWYYVVYAGFWLVLGLFMFKGFCRYICPLGAFMAIGGLLRLQRWIPRRAACGSPCQLCTVRCGYGAIDRSGTVNYSECFGCLECVEIHDDAAQCVPLVLAEKKAQRGRGKTIIGARPSMVTP